MPKFHWYEVVTLPILAVIGLLAAGACMAWLFQHPEECRGRR
ncbi:MAG: hypothetical protein WC052_00415 [Patescibacteria group bacterium]